MRAHLATLVEEFRKHAAETAVVAHRGNRRSPTPYGQLAEIAGRFAAELELRGINPGERVVLWGENSAEWIGVFFGCLLRGVLAVPLDAAQQRYAIHSTNLASLSRSQLSGKLSGISASCLHDR